MNNKLTLKQQRFCDHYLSGAANATEAVVRAGYNISRKNGKPDRLLARNIASENLAKPGIAKYISEKLQSAGITDEIVVREHALLINQHFDLSVKLRAIDMYYRLKGSYPVNKLPEDTRIVQVNVVKYSSTVVNSQ